MIINIENHIMMLLYSIDLTFHPSLLNLNNIYIISSYFLITDTISFFLVIPHLLQGCSWTALEEQMELPVNLLGLPLRMGLFLEGVALPAGLLMAAEFIAELLMYGLNIGLIGRLLTVEPQLKLSSYVWFLSNLEKQLLFNSPPLKLNIIGCS